MTARSPSVSRLRRSLLASLVLLPAQALIFPGFARVGAQPASGSAARSTSIRTPDFDESVRWYQDKLGFRLISSTSFVQGRTAVLERSGFLLEIAEVDHVLPEADWPSTPAISLIVPDVDKEIARLRKAGVDVLQDPEDDLDGRYRTAEIRDNGRHRIELREPIAESGGFNPTGR